MQKKLYFTGVIFSNLFTYMCTTWYVDKKYICISRGDLPDKYRSIK